MFEVIDLKKLIWIHETVAIMRQHSTHLSGCGASASGSPGHAAPARGGGRGRRSAAARTPGSPRPRPRSAPRPLRHHPPSRAGTGPGSSSRGPPCTRDSCSNPSRCNDQSIFSQFDDLHTSC